jgi:hypothetical protein
MISSAYPPYETSKVASSCDCDYRRYEMWEGAFSLRRRWCRPSAVQVFRRRARKIRPLHRPWLFFRPLKTNGRACPGSRRNGMDSRRRVFKKLPDPPILKYEHDHNSCFLHLVRDSRCRGVSRGTPGSSSSQGATKR